MCDVSCTLISGSFLHPLPLLILPQLCETDPPAHVAVDATEVRRTFLFWTTDE